MAKRKNPAAVALGRRGGKARVKKQTPEERSESARQAARARWAAAASPKVRSAKAKAKRQK